MENIINPTNSVEEIARELLEPITSGRYFIIQKPDGTRNWREPFIPSLNYEKLVVAIADALRAERKNSFLQELQESDAIQVKLTKENADLRARLEADRQSHGDLLAVIHGDGGHYIEEHGWEKAQADAVDIVYKLKAERERGELAQIALLRISAVFQDVSEFSCETINCSILKSRGKQVFELATSAMLPIKPEVEE